MHPARRSYLSAFQALAPARRRRRRRPAARPGRSPRRGGCSAATGRRTYDVVLAGDWTVAGTPGSARLRALQSRGLRVAVLHLDDLDQPAARRWPTWTRRCRTRSTPAGSTRSSSADDVRARLVVVRSPAVLRYPPAGPSGVRADRVIIEASAAVAPRRCVAASRRLFGADPLWAPPGPAGRGALAATPGGLALTELDLPGTVDPDGWRLDRRGPRADRPVVGRHCLGNRAEWRRLRDQLPDPARVDVRLLDGTGTAGGRSAGAGRRAAGWSTTPPS